MIGAKSLDLAVIGSGPAAFAAAIYVARAGFKVEIFEKEKIGGALTEISKIENYPGFIGSGAELAENMKKQAEAFGVKITYGTCESVEPLMIDGDHIKSRAVLIATGSEPKIVETKTSSPVSYCALCDGPLFKGKDVAVLGGGNSAIQESLFLANIAKSVTIFTHSDLKAEKYLVEKLQKSKNVKVVENTEPTAEELNQFAGIFAFIGKRPASMFLPQTVLSSEGFVKTKDYQTAMPGVFAAGDIREGSVKQAITAAGDGALAALSIIKFLQNN